MNLPAIISYKHAEKLTSVCKSFQGQFLDMCAMFMGRKIPICNCNAIGDILEDIFYPIIKESLPDFEEGPKQASPDYYGMNKQFEFEQKVFMSSPCFDIGNFTSYVNQLCQDGGVYKKLFMTKYLIFEYAIINSNTYPEFSGNDESLSHPDKIVIKEFHYLNVYNLVSYTGKNPLSMQIKKNIWYNIRPDSVKKWYSSEKTPQLFIESIVKCIIQCPHIENKTLKINTINTQFNILKLEYTF